MSRPTVPVFLEQVMPDDDAELEAPVDPPEKVVERVVHATRGMVDGDHESVLPTLDLDDPEEA